MFFVTFGDDNGQRLVGVRCQTLQPNLSVNPLFKGKKLEWVRGRGLHNVYEVMCFKYR